jgi:MscS family membrane protein
MRGNMFDASTNEWWANVTDFFDTTAGYFVAAFIVIVLAWVARFIFIFIVERYLTKLTSRTQTDVDDILIKKIKAPIGNIIFFIGMYFAIMFLRLPRDPYDWHKLSYNIIDTFIVLMVLWALLRIIELICYLLTESWKRHAITQYDQALPFLRDLTKILVVIGAVIAAVIAWDKDPTALLAGLGIGGLAIGFAAKDTISNIFGSVTIFADKPFDVGDWVIIDKNEGIVEEVGFRTTRVRTFDKTLITIPNSIIANTAVENFSKRPRRRVVQKLGVLYETPIEKIQTAVESIRKILIDHGNVEQEPLLVYFDEFGDSALIIFLYYFTTTANWGEYLEIKQDVNLKIMKLFEDMSIEFAYPTRTLWHKGDLGFGGMPKLTDGDFEDDI